MNEETQKILNWQQSQDPAELRDIMRGIDPLVNSAIFKWRGGGVSDAELKIRGKVLALEALKTFDPEKGNLSTHINNRIQKVSRRVYRSTGVITIPEHRAIQTGNYKRTGLELTDKLGREPTSTEIADHMKIPVKEVDRLARETRVSLINRDTGDSELFGAAVEYKPHIADAFTAIQFDMTPSEQNIFEDITGYGKGVSMKPGAVAQKHGLSGSQISRLKTKWAKQMEDYL